MSNISYRKDIDGLRALAVMAVVLFHLDISVIKSGFLGVDIFFVISGYLITSIIVRDLNKGSFSLKNFYLRRMRRILPALITVLIFSTFLAWLVLTIGDLQYYAKSLVSALGSFSNLFFFKSLNFGYFSTDASIIPLLHTWSLGVEEQFYIFWPLFLILMFVSKFSWKGQTISLFTKMLICSICLFIISVFCFFFLSAPKYYYFPLTRAFELLFGCILAIYMSKKEYIQIETAGQKLLSHILSIVALIMMLVPILCVNVTYPNYWTIVACFGATLFIFLGSAQNHTPVVNKLFSFKLFVAIGLISYSLYLWHWPLIAYLNYLSIVKTFQVDIAVLIVSIVLATLTYFFVEKIFRYNVKISFAKSVIFLWITPIILACVFALASRHVSNFAFNSVSKTTKNQTSFYGALKKEYLCYNEEGENPNFLADSAILPNVDKCTIGQKAVKPNVLIIGDSHAFSDTGMLNVLLKNAGLSGYVITQSSTPFLIAKNYQKIYVPNVTNRTKAIIDLIDKEHFKYIVIAGNWVNHKPVATLKKRLENDIKLIKDHGAIPVIIKDNPGTNLQPTCGLSRVGKLLKSNCYTQRDTYDKHNLAINNGIDNLKKEYKDIIIIDPSKIICNQKRCFTSIDETPLYFNQDKDNNSHLSFAGSALIGNLYIKEFGNPFKEKNIN